MVCRSLLRKEIKEQKWQDDEKLMVHFLKRGRKLMNAGELKEPRLSEPVHGVSAIE